MTLGSLRREFPALVSRPGRPAPVYLDSACMSLVPRSVLEAMTGYYRDYPGCGGRSLHRYAEEVGRRVEAARAAVARYGGAPSPAEVVFLRNSTEAINLVAQGWSWQPGDRVLITDQEHNSNLIVWQRLRDERGIALDVLRLRDDGRFEPEALEAALTPSTRLVSLFHTSNLDGRSLPIREIAERVHARGAALLVDGCQAAPHGPVRLDELGADYYAVSGHKMLGPTGTGVLAARTPEALRRLRPLVVGGETVLWSTLEGHELRPPPHRFEAGLQNYAGVIGAGAALEFFRRVDWAELHAHELRLNRSVTKELADEPRVHLLGPADPAERRSIFAFHLDGIDPNDGALFLDEAHRVLLRSGMHCVHSWYRAHGLNGTLRASFYLYTRTADARALVTGGRELLDRIPGGPAPSAPVAG